MKKSKKLLLLIPVMGLFLTGCTLQEILGSVKDFFTFTKEEKESGNNSQQNGSSSGGETTPSVNALWPAASIASALSQYQITDTVPGYTGASDEITFDDDYFAVSIKVPTGSTEAAVLTAYMTDVTKAGYTDSGEKTADNDSIYQSPNKQIYLIAYKGSDVSKSGYVIVQFTPASTGEDTDLTATKIMQDVAMYAWGDKYDPSDIEDPDSNGVVGCKYVIELSGISNPEDSASCLNAALTSFITGEGFPSYLTKYDDPEYTANAIQGSIGVSEVLLLSSDQELTLYMYDYYYQGSVCIHFEAGPTSNYFQMS